MSFPEQIVLLCQADLGAAGAREQKQAQDVGEVLRHVGDTGIMKVLQQET